MELPSVAVVPRYAQVVRVVWCGSEICWRKWSLATVR